MHEPTAIRLRHCAKTFADGTSALQPLDLDIGAGETVVLLGPSGCGKTTILRAIAGFEPLQSGTIRLAGRELSGDSQQIAPEQRQRITNTGNSDLLFLALCTPRFVWDAYEDIEPAL